MNLIENGSFEIVSSSGSCATNTINPLNQNPTCYNGWYAAVGSANISNQLFTDGTKSVLLDADAQLGPCNQDIIYQNLTLIPGNEYTLSFDERFVGFSFSPYLIKQRVSVFFGSGLTQNAPTVLGPEPCIAYPSTWQKLWELDFASNAWVWVNRVITFTVPANSTNNQLIIAVRPLGANPKDFSGHVFDDFNLICTSGCMPVISATTNNLNVQLSETSNCEGVIKYVWSFGDGTVISDGANTEHIYATAGTYTICVNAIYEDGCETRTCTQVTVHPPDPCICGKNSEVLDPGQHPWTGVDRIIENDIIVTPGAHLLIDNSTLRFRENCKLVVMRGASAEVTNNSLLTVACDSRKWNGIHVWGNNAIDHMYVDIANPTNTVDNWPGVLKVNGGSTLQFMQRGMQAQRPWFDNHNEAIYAFYSNDYFPIIPNYWGGVVEANDAHFLDNRLSAEFHEYPGTTNLYYRNRSSFTDCEFFNDGTFLDDNTYEGVNIWATNGIYFDNCNFNSVGSRGISALDAEILVKRSDVLSNTQGIALGSSGARYRLIEIGTSDLADQNNFRFNGQGIWADGVNFLSAQNNDFILHGQAGVDIAGPSSYEIRNGYLNQGPLGIRLTNTYDENLQQIDCNNFVKTLTSIRARANCAPMTFRQNSFSSNLSDLTLEGFTVSQGNVVPGSIKLNQGTKAKGVFNFFSTNELLNDIVTQGTTTIFKYFPPILPPNAPAILVERTIPDCDMIGFGGSAPCSTNYDFQNQVRQIATVEDCSGNIGPTPPCYTRSCVQGLFQSWSDMVHDGADPALVETALIDLSTAKRAYILQVLADDQFEEAEGLLIDLGAMADKKLLCGLYISARKYSEARAVLNTMIAETDEDQAYMATQHIWLDFLKSPAIYQLSDQDNQYLVSLGETFRSSASYARTVYYLIKGIWITPIEPEPETMERSIKNKSASDAPLAYPMPAHQSLAVELDQTYIGRRYSIQNLLGQQVASGTISDVLPLELNTTIYPAGQYVLHINGDRPIHLSFVVAH
jgi:PKD domain